MSLYRFFASLMSERRYEPSHCTHATLPREEDYTLEDREDSFRRSQEVEDRRVVAVQQEIDALIKNFKV